MKKLSTTALATLVTICTYSQVYLPLTAGSDNQVSGNLFLNADTYHYANMRFANGHGLFGDNSNYPNWIVTPNGWLTNGSINASTLNLGGALTGTSATFIGTGEFGNYVKSGDFSPGYTIGLAAGTTAKGVNIGFSGDYDAGFIGAVHNGTGWKTLLLQPIAGNVGIGTTNPNAKLEIKSSGEVPIVINTNSFTSPAYTQYQVQNSSGWEHGMSGQGDSFKYFFSYGPFGVTNTKMALTSGGNVLIGTTSDNGTDKLQVNGRVSGVSATFAENVGISVNNLDPEAKLTVGGKIKAREIKVTIDAGADFVFEKDHNLMPLTEIAAFISANKHLPEMASADKMKKEGIELGEMNIKLLQKIEELTLYMIDFNKKMEVISCENQILKTKVAQLEVNK